MISWVYRNLTRGKSAGVPVYSVLQRGRLVAHQKTVYLGGVVFKVRPGGQARVRRERRRNVHAFVLGVALRVCPRRGVWVRVRYNPYEDSGFTRMDTGTLVTEAKLARLDEDGLWCTFDLRKAMKDDNARARRTGQDAASRHGSLWPVGDRCGQAERQAGDLRCPGGEGEDPSYLPGSPGRGLGRLTLCGERCYQGGMHYSEEAVATIIEEVCRDLASLLKEKNKAYGNSALDPVRIFSKASPEEQIRVRIDDKLSRLVRGQAGGEDVRKDLMGYLVLWEVSDRLKAKDTV